MKKTEKKEKNTGGESLRGEKQGAMSIQEQCHIPIAEDTMKQKFNKMAYRQVAKQYDVIRKETLKQCRAIVDPDMVNDMESRLKTYKSITDKLKKKNLEREVGQVIERVRDVAGIRIICYTLDELYEIVEKLKTELPGFVIKEKDYVKSPKKSGYRSYHLVLGMPMPGEMEGVYCPVEIQVRTLLMDYWSVMEYKMGYKCESKNGKDETLLLKMKRYSKKLYLIDKELNELDIYQRRIS